VGENGIVAYGVLVGDDVGLDEGEEVLVAVGVKVNVGVEVALADIVIVQLG
jgi:prefoldin subunit 5